MCHIPGAAPCGCRVPEFLPCPKSPWGHCFRLSRGPHGPRVLDGGPGPCGRDVPYNVRTAGGQGPPMDEVDPAPGPLSPADVIQPAVVPLQPLDPAHADGHEPRLRVGVDAVQADCHTAVARARSASAGSRIGMAAATYRPRPTRPGSAPAALARGPPLGPTLSASTGLRVTAADNEGMVHDDVEFMAKTNEIDDVQGQDLGIGYAAIGSSSPGASATGTLTPEAVVSAGMRDAIAGVPIHLGSAPSHVPPGQSASTGTYHRPADASGDGSAEPARRRRRRRRLI